MLYITADGVAWETGNVFPVTLPQGEPEPVVEVAETIILETAESLDNDPYESHMDHEEELNTEIKTEPDREVEAEVVEEEEEEKEQEEKEKEEGGDVNMGSTGITLNVTVEKRKLGDNDAIPDFTAGDGEAALEYLGIVHSTPVEAVPVEAEPAKMTRQRKRRRLATKKN